MYGGPVELETGETFALALTEDEARVLFAIAGYSVGGPPQNIHTMNSLWEILNEEFGQPNRRHLIHGMRIRSD